MSGILASRFFGLRAVFVTLALLIGTTGIGLAAASPARASSSFDNAAVATAAEAHADGSNGGQCKAFANAAVNTASSGTISLGGYQQGYATAGGVEVTSANATRGDIIQVTPLGSTDATVESMYDAGNTALHTAIIVTNNGGNSFYVVDSNWGNNELVQHHNFNPYTWATGKPGGGIVKIWRMGTVSGATGSGTPRRNTADFDNNGADDLVLLTNQPSGGVAVNVGKSTYTGYWMQTWWNDPYTDWSTAKPMTGDVSGDGIADYVFLIPTPTGVQAWVAKSNGSSGFYPSEAWWTVSGWGYSGIKSALGDMDGDGDEDLVLTTSEPGGGTAVNVGLSTRTSFSMQPHWWADPYTDWNNMMPLVGDVTGDKVADYTFLQSTLDGTRAWMLKSTKSGLNAPQEWWSSSGWDYTKVKANMGDIDGNGANDLVLTYRQNDGSTALYIGKSTMLGFWMEMWWADPYTAWDSMTPFVGNVNGDGNDDYGFIGPSPVGTKAWVLRSTNEQLLSPQVWWDGVGWGYSGIKVAQR